MNCFSKCRATDSRNISIAQILKVVLSLLFSFPSLTVHEKNFFWFEKPAKSLVVTSKATNRLIFV